MAGLLQRWKCKGEEEEVEEEEEVVEEEEEEEEEDGGHFAHKNGRKSGLSSELVNILLRF
jgi:hypothetical protein